MKACKEWVTFNATKTFTNNNDILTFKEFESLKEIPDIKNTFKKIKAVEILKTFKGFDLI